MERAQSFKVERHIYIPEWYPTPPPQKKITSIFGVWQVGDDIGVIRWLKASNDGQPPLYPRVWVTRGKLCFLLLRQQIYVWLTILRFRKSLVYFNCVQLFIYFFLQFEVIERHEWRRNSEFVLHGFEIFWFSVVRGKFYQHGFVPKFITQKVTSTDIWFFLFFQIYLTAFAQVENKTLFKMNNLKDFFR